MDRNSGWCTIVCLVGGGQEINTGEAGIEEWILALKNKFPLWKIYFSNTIIETDNYIENKESICWAKNNGIKKSELHLSTSMRSFRSKKLSEYVESLLALDHKAAKDLIQHIQNKYPLYITRNLKTAKTWLKLNSRGSERSGIVVSSNARRLRASGIDAENGVRSNSDRGKITSWFLAENHDIRSSSFLEVPATQFAIQGLELDWVCLAWGGDLSFNGINWDFRKFIGSKWVNIRGEKQKEFLINTYRVLLTRARQGIIIYIPEGDDTDMTRPKEQYDKTFIYLKEIGMKEV